ncbi:hypothetical protein pb186bvf_011718 [Paramecium bursaria]
MNLNKRECKEFRQIQPSINEIILEYAQNRSYKKDRHREIKKRTGKFNKKTFDYEKLLKTPKEKYLGYRNCIKIHKLIIYKLQINQVKISRDLTKLINCYLKKYIIRIGQKIISFRWLQDQMIRWPLTLNKFQRYKNLLYLILKED